MKKYKLSVALATFNEEKNLARCLDSVKGWVDEIVVVDGSSTDKTREIAKKFGAKIIKTTNKPVFHINKQKAIDRCSGEWILQLDADEVVDAKLKQEILKIVRKGSNFTAFWIPRKNYFLGKFLQKTGQYPDSVIRFFKKEKAWLPCKSVHEQVEVMGKVGCLKGHLFHYGNKSLSEYLKRSNRYTTLTAKELLDSGERPGIFSFLRAVIKAKKTFLILFFRNKGFLDGFPGFVFSFYSGLHHLTAYVKFWEMNKEKRGADIGKDWE
ncbi:MAG: glycosyltransferase family 2 protein [Candidatus Shapirobacteria bacterium]